MSQRVDRIMNRVRELQPEERIELARRVAELITTEERVEMVRKVHFDTLEAIPKAAGRVFHDRTHWFITPRLILY